MVRDGGVVGSGVARYGRVPLRPTIRYNVGNFVWIQIEFSNGRYFDIAGLVWCAMEAGDCIVPPAITRTQLVTPCRVARGKTEFFGVLSGGGCAFFNAKRSNFINSSALYGNEEISFSKRLRYLGFFWEKTSAV